MNIEQNSCLQREWSLLEKIKSITWWHIAQDNCASCPDITSTLFPQCYLLIYLPRINLRFPVSFVSWCGHMTMSWPMGLEIGAEVVCMCDHKGFSVSVLRKKSVFLPPFSPSCWLEYGPHDWSYIAAALGHDLEGVCWGRQSNTTEGI